MTGSRDRQIDGKEKMCHHLNKCARTNTTHPPIKEEGKVLSMKETSKKGQIESKKTGENERHKEQRYSRKMFMRDG